MPQITSSWSSGAWMIRCASFRLPGIGCLAAIDDVAPAGLRSLDDQPIQQPGCLRLDQFRPRSEQFAFEIEVDQLEVARDGPCQQADRLGVGEPCFELLLGRQPFLVLLPRRQRRPLLCQDRRERAQAGAEIGTCCFDQGRRSCCWRFRSMPVVRTCRAADDGSTGPPHHAHRGANGVRAASGESNRGHRNLVLDQLVAHFLLEVGGTRAQAGQTVDDVLTRWKRSRSFRTTMSKGVVVVPSSL